MMARRCPAATCSTIAACGGGGKIQEIVRQLVCARSTSHAAVCRGIAPQVLRRSRAPVQAKQGVLSLVQTAGSLPSHPDSRWRGGWLIELRGRALSGRPVPPPNPEGSAGEEVSKARRVWTVPNIICMTRIAASPGICLLLAAGEAKWALGGLAIAAVSDALDGFIARTMDQKSVLGSYLDPLADKVLIMSLSCTCAAVDLLPWWLVTLIVVRDSSLVTAAYLVAHRAARKQGVSLYTATIGADMPLEIQATSLSKINTTVQLSLLAAALTGAAVPETNVAYMVPALVYVTSATTVASMVDYIRRPGYASGRKFPR